MHRHHGVSAMDAYAYASRLRGWNAGFKTILSLGTLLLCVAADHLWVSLAVLASMSVLTIWRGGLHASDYGALLTVPLGFLLLSGLAIAIGVARTPLGEYQLQLGALYFYSSKSDLWAALCLCLRALGAVSAMYMLTLSTPASELVETLRRAHVPKTITVLMHLIYRYIFVLFEAQAQMNNAARSRLGYRNFRSAVRSFGGVAGNLLVVSLRRANTYFDALLARGYQGELRFLEEDKPICLWQPVAAAVYWLLLGLLWWMTK